jgi:hypothetical protein
MSFPSTIESRVGIATGYGSDDQVVGVRVPVESRIFTCPYRSDWHWISPKPIQWEPGALSQGVEQ